MYETVKHFGHPAYEARVAKAIAARLGPDYDHDGALRSLEPLDQFFATAYGAAGSIAAARSAMQKHEAMRLRLKLIAAHARGQTPPQATTAIDTAAIARLLLAPCSNPLGVGGLVAKLSSAVDEDTAELGRLKEQIDSTPEPQEGSLREWIDRQIEIENRLPRRQKALEGFRTAFPASLTAAVGSQREQLVSGLAEARALSGKLPAVPAVDHLIAELAEVDGQLGKLASFAKGPTAARLQQQRAGIVGQIDAVRAQHASAVMTEICAEVDRMVAGDIGAWASVCQTLHSHPDCFPADLAKRITGAGLGPLTTNDPDLFCDVLESKHHREF